MVYPNQNPVKFSLRKIGKLGLGLDQAKVAKGLSGSLLIDSRNLLRFKTKQRSIPTTH